MENLESHEIRGMQISGLQDFEIKALKVIEYKSLEDVDTEISVVFSFASENPNPFASHHRGLQTMLLRP